MNLKFLSEKMEMPFITEKYKSTKEKIETFINAECDLSRREWDKCRENNIAVTKDIVERAKLNYEMAS